MQKKFSKISRENNCDIAITEMSGNLIASITLHGDSRYLESTLCAYDALKITDSRKTDSSELNDKIDTYSFVFYANDLKRFHAELDNSSKADFSELKLTSYLPCFA